MEHQYKDTVSCEMRVVSTVKCSEKYSKREMDLHADTCVVGDPCSVINNHNRYGYDPKQSQGMLK